MKKALPRVAVTHGGDLIKLEAYLVALERVGLEAVPVSAGTVSLAGEVEGLVLTGGGDISPARYGQTRANETREPDLPRDEMEAELLHRALDSDQPVLAICRGMQFFNVAHGGTLIQHLEGVAVHRQPGQLNVHDVLIRPGTKLAAIIGEERYRVNSRHHQGVGEVGRNLAVAAESTDGVIEALERPDKRFAVGVQWHPEDRIETSKGDLNLFSAFASAVRKKA